MSVCTILWINAKYTPEDVADMLSTIADEPKRKAKKVEYKHTHYGHFSHLVFEYNGEKRMMSVFSPCTCPVGVVTSLQLGAGSDAEAIMREIAKRVGGILQSNDCAEKFEVIQGVAYEEDGLAYFLKYGIMRGLITGRSLPQLKKVIEGWIAEVRPGESRMEL